MSGPFPCLLGSSKHSIDGAGEGDSGPNLPSRKPAWDALGERYFRECHLYVVRSCAERMWTISLHTISGEHAQSSVM